MYLHDKGLQRVLGGRRETEWTWAREMGAMMYTSRQFATEWNTKE
jgi:hypothetical protein